MRVLILDQIKVVPKQEVDSLLKHFSINKGEDDSSFEKAKCVIGDRKGFKLNLYIRFDEKNEQELELLEELKQCQEIIITCANVYKDSEFFQCKK